MRLIGRMCMVISGLALSMTVARADSYGDTIALFQNAGASSTFFHSSYGYAVLPTVRWKCQCDSAHDGRVGERRHGGR
jgi:hypothetical protein